MTRHRLLTIATATALAVCAWAFWPRRPTGTATPPPADAKLLATLRKTVTMRFDATPLEELLDGLAARHGLHVELDRAALRGPPPVFGLPISLDVQHVPLGSLVKLMAESAHEDLTAIVDGHRVLVTTRQRAFDDPRRFVARAYPFPPELRRPDVFDENSFAQLVTAIEPGCWAAAGGQAEVHGFPGGVAVVVAPEVQRQVATLLEDFAAMRRPDDPSLTMWIGEPATPESVQAEAALRQRVSLNERDKPLASIVAELVARCQAPMAVDLRELAAVGLDQPSLATPVTIRLEDVELRSALRHLLREFDMAATVRHGIVLITTMEGAEDEDLPRLYGVADLVAAGLTHDDLARLITSSVDPGTWPEGTGPGPIRQGPETLMFPQMRYVHEHAEEFLDTLRRDRLPYVVHDAEQGCPIRNALRQRADLLEGELSLDELAAYLRQRYEMNVVLDDNSLGAVGASTETRVRCGPAGASLARALEASLRPAELGYIVRDEALVIVAREWAGCGETVLVTVRHLLDDAPLRPHGPNRCSTVNELAETLRTHCGSGSGDDVSDWGGMVFGTDGLMSWATPAERRAVESLLRAVDRANDEPNRQSSIRSSEHPATRVYCVNDLVERFGLDSTVAQMRILAPAERWASIAGRGRISALRVPRASIVVVTQTDEVHAAIEALLRRHRNSRRTIAQP